MFLIKGCQEKGHNIQDICLQPTMETALNVVDKIIGFDSLLTHFSITFIEKELILVIITNNQYKLWAKNYSGEILSKPELLKVCDQIQKSIDNH